MVNRRQLCDVSPAVAVPVAVAATAESLTVIILAAVVPAVVLFVHDVKVFIDIITVKDVAPVN